MRCLLLMLSLLSSILLAAACREDPVCKDRLDNDCNRSCQCPAGEYCLEYGSILGDRGSNSCSKDCTQQSDCPDSTSCVEISSGGTLERTIEGQCWPTCTKATDCRGETDCSETKLYPGGPDIRACF
jgi:hypothetical protein